MKRVITRAGYNALEQDIIGQKKTITDLKQQLKKANAEIKTLKARSRDYLEIFRRQELELAGFKTGDRLFKRGEL